MKNNNSFPALEFSVQESQKARISLVDYVNKNLDTIEPRLIRLISDFLDSLDESNRILSETALQSQKELEARERESHKKLIKLRSEEAKKLAELEAELFHSKKR